MGKHARLGLTISALICRNLTFNTLIYDSLIKWVNLF